MKLTFLGTGTSTGVPQIGCTCDVCMSSDPHDKRLRTSALIEVKGRNLLIDCGPDFRAQILGLGSPNLTAALITHTHYDHLGGVDDLRPYCYPDSFHIYCRNDVAEDLRARIPYSFAKNPYPGVPTFKLHEIKENESFEIDGIKILPVPVSHYKLKILGFRINRLAYITDCKTIADDAIEMIKGVDTFVINALRIEDHLSHMNLSQALALIGKVKPRVAYLTHLCHQMGKHSDVSSRLPENIFIAYDGLTIEIPD